MTRQAFELNLRHLRALAQIGALGSISAAGESIGLSQPALTQGIARLEQQFGCRLFDRMAQGLRPTATGAAVLLRVERATDRLARTLRAASRSAHGQSHLTTAHVRALVALAENGSIPSAALALGLSEPALHRPLRGLEQICGTLLTERHGRSVVLSEAGRRVAQGFALAMAELEVALQEATRQPGRVAVGAMALPRSMLLPVTVAELSHGAPWAQIDIVDGSYGELVESLRRGAIDIVIGTLREPPDPDLRQEMLLEDWLTVIGRSGHPLAGHNPTLEQLARYPWIVGRRTSALLERWQRIFDAAGIDRPSAPIQCGSVTTIRGILARSDFLTLLSCDQVTAELDAGSLTPIASAIPDTARLIGVITRRDWFPTALQEEFLRLLRRTARKEDGGTGAPRKDDQA